jgi:hypothetical protein
VHNLLARGFAARRLFPGFERRMRRRWQWRLAGSRDAVATRVSRRAHTGLWQLYASRALIEATILDLCRNVYNVTFLERTEVTVLEASPFDGNLHLTIDGQASSVVLGVRVTRQIYVSPA